MSVSVDRAAKGMAAKLTSTGGPFRKGFDPRRNTANGRPKRWKCVADGLRDLAATTNPATGRRRLDELCSYIWGEAMKGKPWACQFLADRTDGKLTRALRTLDVGTTPPRDNPAQTEGTRT